MSNKKDLIARQTALQTELNNLAATIAAMPEDKAGVWVPKMGETYWYVSISATYSYRWDSDSTDKGHLAVGNVYQTKALAARALDRLKVHQELKVLANFVPDWTMGAYRKKYSISINGEELSVDLWMTCRLPNTIYFRTEAEARAAIAKVGEERVKLYCKGE